MRREDLGRYEMLWDCEFCGATGLLGLSQRHCACCGAAQDPARRYFPTEDQKVAVGDHPYFGADLNCPSCDAPNAAKSDFCTACGGPLEGAKAVSTRGEQVAKAGEAFSRDDIRSATDQARERKKELEAERRRQMSGQPTEPKKSGVAKGCMLGCLALLVAGLIFMCVAALWTSDVSATVTAHAWERSVPVEALKEVSKTAWVDQVPRDASNVRCTKEQKDTREVRDGEECATRRKDNGDGTFSEVKECTPTYRSEPVYEDQCRFTVTEWTTVDAFKTSGGWDSTPSWPSVNLGNGQREGARAATYQVTLKGGDETATCTVSEAEYSAMPPGSVWTTTSSKLTGGLSCARLEPAR